MAASRYSSSSILSINLHVLHALAKRFIAWTEQEEKRGILLVEGGQRAHHADHSAVEGRGVEAVVA